MKTKPHREVISLDSIHEIELKLTDEQHTRYRDNLAMITAVCRYPKDLAEAGEYCAANERAYCSATAKQRAEALSKTIGKGVKP